MTTIRVIRYLMLAAVAACGGFLGYVAYTGLDLGAPSGRLAPGAPLGKPFTLVDHTGAEVTEALLAQRPSAVYFGFTFCPEVCPTTLYDLTEWSAELGASAEDLNLVFVTVDPERDTPEVMRQYVTAFSDGMIGITGPPEDVSAMVRSFGIYSAKVETEDGADYSMDHYASVLLLDKNRNLIATISYNEKSETAIAKLRRLLKTGG